jgi:hypothetical protein
MLFDLTFSCYLTTFSVKKCLSGKVRFFSPAYRSSPVHLRFNGRASEEGLVPASLRSSWSDGLGAGLVIAGARPWQATENGGGGGGGEAGEAAGQLTVYLSGLGDAPAGVGAPIG